ncbi:hypothetical protein ABIA33_007110 [Streptacidiphilus sp. MAP12-16]|uniref:hypothetical protein n=1 Tax=Streptacidiphilus sp. MAP12-16 TaxID=3156300 RepID=UPI003515FA9D
MDQVVVTVLEAADRRQDWILTFLEDKDLITISAERPSGLTYSGTGDDYFTALQDLRLSLDAEGLRLLCAGARVDAYPSPMMFDMFRGLTVYIHRMNRQASRKAQLFSPAKASKIATVGAQNAFHDRWLAGRKIISISGLIRGCVREGWYRWKLR